MALDPVLTRDASVGVEDSQTPDTYLTIAGVTNVSHSPSTQTADASTFDAAGRTRNIPVSRGDSFTVSALRIEDESTGDRDPGQEACETLSRKIGQDSFASFQVTFPGGETMTFTGHVQVKILDGGTNDLSSWEATIEVYDTPVFAPAA